MAAAVSTDALVQHADGTVIVETARLFLRPARANDAAHLHEIFKDSEAMRYWSTLPHENISVTTDWVEGMVSSQQNGITDFVICLKSNPLSTEDAIVIGKAGIYSSLPANEIGFLIARQHWRKGFAFEILSALLSYLFNLAPDEPKTEPIKSQTSMATDECKTSLSKEDLAASRWRYPWISADVDPRNIASIAILTKLGFTGNGYTANTYEIGGQWVDSQWFSLRREDFVRD